MNTCNVILRNKFKYFVKLLKTHSGNKHMGRFAIGQQGLAVTLFRSPLISHLEAFNHIIVYLVFLTP